MSVFTGLTSNTKKNIQLDAGSLFKNYVSATDTPSTASSKLIGATVGGSTLSVVPEVRQIAVDGVKGPTKGYEIFECYTGTLTTNVKEITPGAVALALAAATTSTPTAPSSYSKIVPDAELADTDYLTNVTWIGKILGSSDPIIVVFKNALNLNGFSMQVQDKNEGQIPLTLTAHYDPSALDEVPVEIYIPTIS
jgi:hypothetical protein